MVVVVAEQDGGHGGQAGVQALGQHAVLLEQGAPLGGVGALLDVLPVLDLVLVPAALRLEGLVGEAALHDAVNKVDGLGLLRLAGLEGVRLNVLDGARVHLVAVALVGSVVARKDRIRSLRIELWRICG